jgi:hypothetical protein
VRFAQAVEAGMTHVNGMPVIDEPHVAFGGEWIIDELTSAHWISVQHTPRPYSF